MCYQFPDTAERNPSFRIHAADPAGERTAGDLRKAYLANINKIAETIKPELVETYGDEVSGMSNDQITKKLGKPQIYPDSGQVDYVEQEFDDVHVISFEFDVDFSCIDNITIDG